MRGYEGNILIWTSLILAIVQSYNIEGNFKFFGYVMWLVCILLCVGALIIDAVKK